MKTMRTTLGLFLAAGLLPGPALATAQTIDQRRAAEPDGTVEIENPAGTIHVVGWDRNEVAVSGTLGTDAEGLEFRGGAHRTSIAVETHGNPHGVRSDLKVQVPAGSRLRVEGFASSIKIEGVNGPVQAETVNGSIAMTGGSKEVELESVNGSVEVTSPATRVRAEAVNGAVTIRNASGEVDASTVNGRLTIVGGTFSRARLETVSGGLVFEGALAKGAILEAESVSGGVELVLPANVAADFSISTFSGGIENELGPPPRKSSRWTSEKELVWSAGGGGATVSVQTLSGGVRIRKKP
jgi:DUF4097 and DUF4098 domain-containing protein YvlB